MFKYRSYIFEYSWKEKKLLTVFEQYCIYTTYLLLVPMLRMGWSCTCTSLLCLFSRVLGWPLPLLCVHKSRSSFRIVTMSRAGQQGSWFHTCQGLGSKDHDSIPVRGWAAGIMIPYLSVAGQQGSWFHTCQGLGSRDHDSIPVRDKN
jgi:hypothetical protein